MPASVTIGNKSSDHIFIEVMNYEMAANEDWHDSNWLSCRISVSCNAWTGRKFSASFLTSEIESFFNQLTFLNQSLKGEAEFRSLEEQLLFKITASNLGRLTVQGTAISAPTTILSYEFDIDQTYLTTALSELKQITTMFPIREV